jgi:hypothetical protein
MLTALDTYDDMKYALTNGAMIMSPSLFHRVPDVLAECCADQSRKDTAIE